MLPRAFNKYGLLPLGDYELTLDRLKKSMLVKGPAGKSETWDSDWRLNLVENLEILVDQLWEIGIDNIFINGSFTEDKDHPNDIDGYFDCDISYYTSGQLERDLNWLDTHKIWTWDRISRKHDHNSVKQIPMWHIYRVELWPNYNQDSGIRDKYGNPKTFPSAFRQTRNEDRAKGIIKIKK